MYFSFTVLIQPNDDGSWIRDPILLGDSSGIISALLRFSRHVMLPDSFVSLPL